ncbi:non-specific phospholipase C1 [Selaginella moellendorffii]|uniref:non-specific phospholipase C1 n=1 Tax=Selaginella moellendorffii TaxID=88036 RepID=UPI000D1C3AD1|nr:non-specific phospholipase C1 [Selaginella moellendorffii]|eukprot:XP_024523628.1 non-specific phospholipase C1 [Selaginella moellendorffii]
MKWCLVPLFLLLLSPGTNAAQPSGRIKTIVVLVQENRSFDHMLGWLKKLNPEIDGLTGKESNPMNLTDPSSGTVFVSDKAEFVDPDPGHSFGAIRDQVFGFGSTSQNPAPMNGFAQQAEIIQKNLSQRVMSSFRPELVPAYTALAMEFAICDKWFASVPASTQPNRLYIHSATSHGAVSNVRSDLVKGFPQKTIFESIDQDKLSFGIYYQNIPATLFYRNLRSPKYLGKFHNYGLFKTHAKQGKLPNYVVVEQRYYDTKATPANDDHPSHDVAEGQKFIKEVYETLRSSPQWNETLLVITYDEHGGFFDHVSTPMDNVPNPDGLRGGDDDHFNFDRLGVRVPAIFVSPWIDKGTVIHRPNGPTKDSQYEHSSIPATVKKIFNLTQPFLTKRDAWAGTFETVLSSTRTTPRTDCPVTLPSSPWSLRHSPPNEEGRLTEFQVEMVGLASQLNGDYGKSGYPNLGASMTVKYASDYVDRAVEGIMRAGKVALQSGEDPNALIEVLPTSESRKTGT